MAPPVRSPGDASGEPGTPTGVHEVRVERTKTEQDPAELLAGVRQGDAAAFEALARQNASRLYRMALHLTGVQEEAEDLVQETLVRALPALKKFEGRAQLSTYLVRALANLWKNRLRSRSRSRIVDEEPLFDPPDGSSSALERLEAEDAAIRVRAAVARLDPERRMALLLREVEDLSYEEIASITRVPVGTVRSRLARAREDLRRLLGGRP